MENNNIHDNDEVNELNHRIRFNNLRIHRKWLRDRSNPFIIPEVIFQRYYRMRQMDVLLLINLIEHRIRGPRNSIPPYLIVLSMLRFFAHGGFQKEFGNDYLHPIGQSTASRYVNVFLQAVLELSPRFLRFPSSKQERRQISARFQRTIRVPGVIGLVDGFIVCLKRPSENEEAFAHYKHASSVNVQIVVDSYSMIRDIRIVPGSNNDQFNWNFSMARQYMNDLRSNQEIVQQEGVYYLLGDSGYAKSSVLLTPILDAPEESPASYYTYEHVHTRCQVEQTIGLLSGTWKVISRCRKLFYSPEKVCMIINAAAILHNFKKMHGIPYDIPNEHDAIERHYVELPNNGEEEVQGILQSYYVE